MFQPPNSGLRKNHDERVDAAKKRQREENMRRIMEIASASNRASKNQSS